MIAATMLAGNSEAIVADAVRSVIEYVDEFILIDTGITDRTVDIVCDIAKGKFRRERYLWKNDFADARNFAIDVARRAGAKWTLTIDTDERLYFKDFTFDAGVDCLLVSHCDGSYAKERFIRTESAGRWVGRTHECFLCDSRLTLSGVTFDELPKSAEAMKAKLTRDIDLLNKQIEETPNDARWRFYLGQTYDCLNRLEEAAEHYAICAGMGGWDEEAAFACFRAAECYCRLKRFPSAVNAAALGLAIHSGFPELAWMAAYASFHAGDMQKAIHWADMSIAIGHYCGTKAGRDRVGFRHLPGWYEGPFDVLRFINKRGGAQEHYEDAKALRESL